MPQAIQLEHPPLDELESIAQIVSAFKARYLKDTRPGKGLARRAVHAKSHGCLFAQFTVEPNLPEELRVGVFSTAQTYPAWLRFSNGATKPQSDFLPDVRAIAVKLLQVPGEKLLETERNATTQDFILANHPAFFVKNAADFAKLLSGPLSFFFGLNPLHWRLGELGNLAGSFLNPIGSPLAVNYWSQTPYLLGTRAVKYSVRPSLIKSCKSGWLPPANYLREAIAKELSRHEVHLDFLVQVQSCPTAMPVENPTVVWNENVSPFHKVATISISKQDFDTPERDRFGENLSFTPWHSLPEHRPLGGINRARRFTYNALSELRHDMNGVPRQEPC